MTEQRSEARGSGGRRRWVDPALRAIGTVDEILRQGGNKVSAPAAEPAEVRPRRSGVPAVDASQC